MIQYDEQNQIFHLNNGEISYVIKITQELQLIDLYYGGAIDFENDFMDLLNQSNTGFSLQHPSGIPYEKMSMTYGTFGKYSLNEEAFLVKDKEGRVINDFIYSHYEISNQKTILTTLPSSYDNQKLSQTLILYLKERSNDLWIELHITIFPEKPLLTKHVQFKNKSSEIYTIDLAMSGVFSVDGEFDQVIAFNGAWIKEFTTVKNQLSNGKLSFSNYNGVSTHTYQPFLALAESSSRDNRGEVHGFALMYSGNFKASVEKNIYKQTKIQMGINPFLTSWDLKSDSIFETPEWISVYSDEGFDKMTHVFHDFFLNNVMPCYEENRLSDVLINSWEAFYFNIDEEKLVELGLEAKSLGVEVLLVDDGWFENRNDDTDGLGSWVLDRKKFPNGLKVIKEKTGLKLGLWFEPEMTHLKTDRIIGKNFSLTPSRNQFVLDFTREDLVDEVFEKVKKVISDFEIDIIKWDANRPISDLFSENLENQGELYHRYILGVYRFAKKLREHFPHLIIQSCSAGGGRANAGMLSFALSTWVSDNTDACERLRIQQAAAMFLPLRAIGSHVTASPNHQMLRETSFAFRSHVALFGTYGFELNILQLSSEEKEAMVKAISFFKRHRKLIQTGNYYKLKGNDLSTQDEYAHMVVSKDGREVIVGVFQIASKANWEGMRLPLKGLEKKAGYEIHGKVYTGSYLMRIGLHFKQVFTGVQSDIHEKIGKIGFGDRTSEVIYFKKCY